MAEGPKVIKELIDEGIALHSVFCTETLGIPTVLEHKISPQELQKISFLTTANTSLGLFNIPKQNNVVFNGLTVVLDAVRDPGNLGTIIRLCDWFGITQLVCSNDTVDCYNPKVVQATMGSIARVAIHYVELIPYLEKVKVPIYAGMMDGTNVYTENLPANAVIVLGNEANGVSQAVMQKVTKAVRIPQFGPTKNTESLNVATATAILLSEFKRTTET